MQDVYGIIEGLYIDDVQGYIESLLPDEEVEPSIEPRLRVYKLV